MRKVFGLSAIVILLTGTHAFAQRLLTMTVELNGHPVLRTVYEDKGTATPVEIWRNLLSQSPSADPELNEIQPDPRDPQVATLKGPVVVSVEEGNNLIGRAEVEDLTLRRSNTTTVKWYLDFDDVFRTAFAAKLSDVFTSESGFRRLRPDWIAPDERKPGPVEDEPYYGVKWLVVLIPVLIVGALFIGWMYVRDMRTIRWYYALPLGLMRATVYGLLAYMFLLPAVKETRIWKPRVPPELIRHSRVVVLLDVSGSMLETKDDPSYVPEGNRKTRLEKVIEYLSDEKVAFFRKLLENNPVYVYRFASRLDADATPFQLDKDGVIRPFITQRKKNESGQEEQVGFLTRWNANDWKEFAKYADFRRLIYRGLSEAGQKAVRNDFGPETGPGSVEWVEGYLGDKIDTRLARLSLSEDDAAIFRGNINSLDARLNLAKTIALSSNIVGSVQDAFDAEKENKLQSIIVFSDGRSNTGADSADVENKGTAKLNPAFDELHRLAKQSRIPIITIGIGEIRTIKSIRITDLQAPDRVPPDDAFKINAEVDGDNLPGETVDVFLQLMPPGSETPLVLPGKVTFDRSEPPHGQFEWTIDPAEIIKLMAEAGIEVPAKKETANTVPGKDDGKESRNALLPEGGWKVRAYTAKITEEGKAIPMQRVESEMATIQVEKKPVRLLLMGSVANRDFQFLLTQLIRDKADVSVFLQNEAGQFHEGKSIAFLEDNHRQLNRFPEPAYFLVGDNPDESPETKWLNLARYDVIIAFDPDWTQLTLEQTEMVRKWVDLYAGGLLQVAGRVHTPKLAENPSNYDGKTAPILEILPVTPADYTFKVGPAIDRKLPRRLEFPGAAPEMEFLRLDDNKPDDVVSGWEQFFTGAATRELGINAQLRRGFFDYYPIKDVKAGATIVARYMEPQVNENTFDKKEPAFLVTYKYGQGVTAFLGSSEIWRLRQIKDVFFERFWVKMSRFLASGSRKQQNRRGRILMSKTFTQGDALRVTAEILGPDLKGVPSTPEPEITVRPAELDNYVLPQKKGAELTAKDRDDYLKSLTRIFKLAPRKGGKKDDGYFQLQYALAAKDFPAGVWRAEIKIPSSSDVMSQKFVIRKAPSLELADVRPDMLSLAAISSEVDEPAIKDKLTKKPAVYEKLKARAFSAPNLQGQRLAFKFDDKQSLDLIPEIPSNYTEKISNPQTEPEIQRSKIEPRWFGGPTLPRWTTAWYDRWMGTPEKSHHVGVWMLVCVALLSMEWLTRKLLKLA
jgi:hypothetical protein